MLTNGVEFISSRLENICLNRPKMQPKTERPPIGEKGLPVLHLTPSGGHAREGNSDPPGPNPRLLKPQHEIPTTPPPQTKAQPFEYFQQRIG